MCSGARGAALQSWPPLLRLCPPVLSPRQAQLASPAPLSMSGSPSLTCTAVACGVSGFLREAPGQRPSTLPMWEACQVQTQLEGLPSWVCVHLGDKAALRHYIGGQESPWELGQSWGNGAGANPY